MNEILIDLQLYNILEVLSHIENFKKKEILVINRNDFTWNCF
jgi:hypothetical protein